MIGAAVSSVVKAHPRPSRDGCPYAPGRPLVSSRHALLAAGQGDSAALQSCEAILLDSAQSRSDGQRPSMGQDMAKGRRTEIDFINGLVVEKAAELGISVPANAAIVDIVKRIERGELAASPAAVAGI